ncbi:hypothetical protein [Lysinibacillus sp. D4A3_S15]|nr:hypothetical protein [Lysinibacillus sp. D4A3_S15]
MGKVASEGMVRYVEAVKGGTFPAQKHLITMKEDALDQLYGGVKS